MPAKHHRWVACRGHSKVAIFTVLSGPGGSTFSLAAELHRASLGAGIYTLQASVPGAAAGNGRGDRVPDQGAGRDEEEAEEAVNAFASSA